MAGIAGKQGRSPDIFWSHDLQLVAGQLRGWHQGGVGVFLVLAALEGIVVVMVVFWFG